MSTTEATLKESEIRPDTLMKGQAERFENDIRRLLEHKQHFVDVACPACGGAKRRRAFEKYELSYVVCSSCETMYISPRPPPDVLAAYYATSENYAYWNKYIFPASEESRREKIMRPRAERIADICRRQSVRPHTLLEVGSGFGTFCQEVRRLGFVQRIIAVEPTPDLARTCRERGLEVVEKPIEQVRLDARVDVIASFEVIEHLFDPAAFVRECSRLLAPGGLLVLTCPNGQGFDIEALREHSDAVDIEHLNYFNPASLTKLVEEKGLRVLEVTTPGKLDAELVRRKALANRIDLTAQPFLRRVLLEQWERLGEPFQRFLAEQGLSSHMWLVARR